MPRLDRNYVDQLQDRMQNRDHQRLTAFGEQLGFLDERIILPFPNEVGRPETLGFEAHFETVFEVLLAPGTY